MANHAYVKTRRKLTPAYINDLLTRLNKSHFKNLMKITHFIGNDDKPSWLIQYSPDNGPYVERLCWLNSSRNFEIRHGGGPQLAWWIDGTITTFIAHEMNGTQSDDGIGQYQSHPDDFSSFPHFLAKQIHRRTQDQNKRQIYMILENEDTPTPFQDPELSKFTVKITKTSKGFKYTVKKKPTSKTL